jgi:hypothetical protein
VKAIITRNNNLVWYRYLEDIIQNINSQQSARTGFTANQLWTEGYYPATAVAPPTKVSDYMTRDELVSHNINSNEVRAIRQASETPERYFAVGDLVRIRMTKLPANNLYRKAKETGIFWSYVGVHYSPEVYRISIAHHHNKLTSPKRDTYFLQNLDGKNVMSSKSAAVPMEFYGNDLIRVPLNHTATHISPRIGDASIRQANYLNRLIGKKPKATQLPPQPPQERMRALRTQAQNTDERTAPRINVAQNEPALDEIRFQQQNPKKAGSKSYERYELYKHTRHITDALDAGATRADLKWDTERGYLMR